MTSSTPAARSRYALVLLTVVWVVACLALLWWLFTIGMEGWADHHSNGGGRSAEFGRRSARALLLLAATAAGGPAVIALVAFGCRYRRTGLVYLLLAVVAAAALAPAVADAARTLRPPAAPLPAPTTCQEHSGGDSRCPGG
ncbi:DUF6234 family protein [Micromonospora sp. DSM 115977]|uniref:DUF6234 family protein n=1 Tax=Micromonospora reichwaldensis TaxID=3075516 RepID=A0ABU2WQ34_9ACTN|nr:MULTISPECIES: DUF6234 family protein [unclassified Micromonospora]KAB1159179.1 hypothetical protein F6X68_09130 [Micromonospora sp. AMSO12t]MDT0528016.1 DUF6234 family protein [Micromonospora sp. DSM 115977]WSG01187.1 DUF6234 family protein [Micromonospora sp. NBC_01740]